LRLLNRFSFLLPRSHVYYWLKIKVVFYVLLSYLKFVLKINACQLDEICFVIYSRVIVSQFSFSVSTFVLFLLVL